MGGGESFLFKIFLRRDFSLGTFWWAHFFKYSSVEISCGICLENISIQSLFGREFPFTDCLVATFSSDIFGSNFIFKNCLVEISFFLGGGKMFSSNIFL